MAIVIVTLDVQGTTSVTASAGTTVGGLSVEIQGSGIAAQLVTAAPWSASFSGVPAGTYTAVSTPVDGNGKALGSAISSAQFTVQPDVSLDVPSVVSIAVQVN